MNNVTLCATSYEFTKPKDENGNPINGRTSLSISKEINSKLGTFEYEYNKNRFISKIKEVSNGNASIKTYKYDEFSRLVESANGDGSKIYKYKYDSNGNVLEVERKINGQIIKKEFVYDSIIKDKLLSVNLGASVTSIQYANNDFYPTKIGNLNLTWGNDTLIEVSNNDLMLHFDYDSNGLRISKNSSGQITKYTYDRGRLIEEKQNNDTKIFIYDDKNDIVGFVRNLNGVIKKYVYLKNNIGIICALMDETGRIVQRYYYDDYGYLLAGQNIDYKLNSILYKGYYYDHETNLYYLKSRYYSPFLMRFISPDKSNELFKNIEDYNQFNLFTYCNNNPINLKDENGCNWFTDLFKGVCNFVKTIFEINIAIGVIIWKPLIDGTIQFFKSLTKGDGLIQSFNNAIATGKEFFNDLLYGNTDGKTNDDTSIFKKWFANVIQENIGIIFNALSKIHKRLAKLPLKALLCGTASPLTAVIATYLAIQATCATINFVNNRNALADPNKTIIGPIIINDEGESVPLLPTNILIDGKIYLTNQNNNLYKNIRFGFNTFDFNGCEIMAMYNYLTYKNIEVNLPILIYYFEMKNLLFGLLGVFHIHLIEYLDMRNISHTFYSNLQDTQGLTTSNCEVAILSTFNNVPNGNKTLESLLGIHTTTAIKINDYCVKFNGERDVLKDKFLEINKSVDENQSDNIYNLLNNFPRGKFICAIV